MTDTTHEAPERINVIVQSTRNGFYKSVGHKGGSRPFAAEYIRADLVHAAVAAALREAAQAIQGDEMLSPIGAHRVSARILTLIPEDAQAALDRAIAAAIRKGGSNACVSCGAPTPNDFCGFCLEEE